MGKQQKESKSPVTKTGDFSCPAKEKRISGDHSTNPYFTLMRSGFSSMGSAAMRINTAAAMMRLLIHIHQMTLNIEAVIAFIAIQAKFPAAGEPDPVGAGGFAAAVADIGIEQPCLFGQTDCRFLHIKHLFRAASLIVGKGLRFGHAFGLWF